MHPRRRKGLIQILVGVIVLLVVIGLYSFEGGQSDRVVSTFAECAGAGHSVMESYPRRCKSPDGKTFREDIGNELEKDDLIRIEHPRPNSVVISPLAIRGMARGSWFFEASFPVFVVDGNGNIIGQGVAQAQGNKATGEAHWMTEDFVPFAATITLDTAHIQGRYSNHGTLILKKDNPSDNHERDDALEIPIQFGK
jgi:hypothetical protein